MTRLTAYAEALKVYMDHPCIAKQPRACDHTTRQ